MGNSGPGVLEFKAFALSYNSTLPLYNKHTENKQKKGLNVSVICLLFLGFKQTE